jgi:FdhD protein
MSCLLRYNHCEEWGLLGPAWLFDSRRGVDRVVELSRLMQFVRFEDGRMGTAEGSVVREGLVRLHVNGRELVRLMCTPEQLDYLALGFLYSEGLIRELADVRLLVVCPSRTCVDIWLRNAEAEPPGRPSITSGCGGGITFADLEAAGEPVQSGLSVRATQIGRLMTELLTGQATRGIHRAGLADADRVLIVSEDVGRHNTLDKVLGFCLREGIVTQDRILLTTGRISSEMLGKAARMGVPIVVSRTSPTSLSVALAEAWNITLVGYARRSSMNVYTGQERVLSDEETPNDANS